MIRRRIGARTLAAVLIVVALVVAGVGLTRHSGSASSKATPKHAGRWQLTDLEQGGASRSLVSLFNQGSGAPRVLLLVSPT